MIAFTAVTTARTELTPATRTAAPPPTATITTTYANTAKSTTPTKNYTNTNTTTTAASTAITATELTEVPFRDRKSFILDTKKILICCKIKRHFS